MRKVLNRSEKQNPTELVIDFDGFCVYCIYIYIFSSIFLEVPNLLMSNCQILYAFIPCICHIWYPMKDSSLFRPLELPVALSNELQVAAFCHWKSWPPLIGPSRAWCFWIPPCRRGSDPFPFSKIHVTGGTLRHLASRHRDMMRHVQAFVPSKSAVSNIVPHWEEEQIPDSDTSEDLKFRHP